MNTLRLTRAQVREVDRIAIEEYGIPGIVLMENAALAVTAQVVQMREDPQLQDEVLILCGNGNNGGDGLAIARHLYIRGVPVTVALMGDPVDFKGDAKINFDIVQRMRIYVVSAAALPRVMGECEGGLVIDAIYGSSFRSPATIDLRAIVSLIHKNDIAVVAVDVPSGMDCDTGAVIANEVIPAGRTVTFVAEKAGFASAAARALTGEIVVGDIGIPPEIIARVTSPSADPR